MSQDELLPEELNDCQRVLESLVPRASRIDRDRLMIRLGEQSAAGGSIPWKWATGASLMLALVLGLRPELIPPDVGPAQVAVKNLSDVPRSPEGSQPIEQDDDAPHAVVRSIDDEVDWLLTMSSVRFDPSRTLTVRPRSAPAVLASRAARAPVIEDSSVTSPPLRTPILRWRDRPLRRGATDMATPPTS